MSKHLDEPFLIDGDRRERAGEFSGDVALIPTKKGRTGRMTRAALILEGSKLRGLPGNYGPDCAAGAACGAVGFAPPMTASGAEAGLPLGGGAAGRASAAGGGAAFGSSWAGELHPTSMSARSNAVAPAEVT